MSGFGTQINFDTKSIQGSLESAGVLPQSQNVGTTADYGQVLQAAGQATKADDGGGALGGAASGAMTGAAVGGPWGAVIGGVIGGLTGIMKSKAADQQRKREAEATLGKQQIQIEQQSQQVRSQIYNALSQGLAQTIRR